MNAIVSKSISGGGASHATVTVAPRQQLVATLRGLLRDVLHLHLGGASAAELARAQGYADGFMLSLQLSGVATQAELLRIVAEARRNSAGPATGTIRRPADSSAAIVAA